MTPLLRALLPLLATLLPLVAQADLQPRIDTAAAALEERLIGWRRDIHEHPELANREVRTAALVAEHLRGLGMEVTTEVAHTGVVGVLRGGRPGPVVALRADMDGLPVTERTGLPFASTQRTTYEGRDVGVMHACGHDNHVAILMAAAEVLAGLKEELSGTVKFVFQPAEEGPPQGETGGAKQMIAEDALKNPDVEAIFGLHISQGDRVGVASYRARGMMASAQRFDIDITGRQTHAARPWSGVDPIVVAAEIVTALQTIVSRNVDISRAPAVVSVGTLEAGVRHNILPDTAHLSGTIRTFDPAVRGDIHQRITRIAEQIASAMGASAEVTIDAGVPVTFNDEGLTASSVPVLERVYGPGQVVVAPLITGAEDFSFFQEQIPGFFFFIGGRSPDVPAAEAVPNHSPLFTVDEAALLPAVKAMAGLAADYLARGAAAETPAPGAQ